MKAWLKSTAGIATGIAIILAAIVVYWKWGDIKAWNHDRHIAKAEQHVETAKPLIVSADSAKKEGVQIRTRHNTLINSPEVRNDTTAQKVVKSSNKVIANTDFEVSKLRAAIAQKDSAIDEYKKAGPPPGPKLVPYIDAVYKFNMDSTAMKPHMVLRAGLDYKILPFTSVKLELERNPAYQLNVGAHIAFR